MKSAASHQNSTCRQHGYLVGIRDNAIAHAFEAKVITVGSGDKCKPRISSAVMSLECAATISQTATGAFLMTPHYTLKVEHDGTASSGHDIFLKDRDTITFTCMPGTTMYRFFVMPKAASSISELCTKLEEPSQRLIKIAPEGLMPNEREALEKTACLFVPEQVPLGVSGATSQTINRGGLARGTTYLGHSVAINGYVTSRSGISAGQSHVKEPETYGERELKRYSLLKKSPLDMYFSSEKDKSGNGNGNGNNKPFESYTYTEAMRQIGELGKAKQIEQQQQQEFNNTTKTNTTQKDRQQQKTFDAPLCFREKLMRPEEIAETPENFGYYLDKDMWKRLVDTLYLILHRPDLSSLLSSPRPVSHTVLVHGESGCEKYMEALGRALARHLGAHILVVGKDDFRKPKSLSKSKKAGQGKYSGSSSNSSNISAQGQARDGNEDDDDDDDEITKESVSTAEGNDDETTQVQEQEQENEENNDNDYGCTVLLGDYPVGRTPQPRDVSVGDRVKYDGTSQPLLHADRLQKNIGPEQGAVGKVLVKTDRYVGVEFDRAFPGGTDLSGRCKKGHGAFVSAKSVRLDVPRKKNPFLDWTSETVAGVGPCIILLKNAEDFAVPPRDRKFYRLTERIARGVMPVAILGTTTLNVTKDFTTPRSNADGPFGLFHFHMAGPLDPRSAQVSFLRALFPTQVQVVPPPNALGYAEWRERIGKDVEAARFETNKKLIQNTVARTKIALCNDDSLNAIPVLHTTLFNRDEVNKIVACAISEHYRGLSNGQQQQQQQHQQPQPAQPTSAKAELTAKDITEAIDMIISTRPSPTRTRLAEVVPDNEFEKALLANVVPPEEAGLSFADIGALDNVKEVLKESVMLPLQRPELFRRGNLTKPTKGILLFGPPGTGKTMLARAIATECGANFLSITPASISSMWFGETEKLVRALFTLAAKIAPTIIFIDEVDSLLSRRGMNYEAEASRKTKNEFMSCWDGLRTNQSERVLVLAATNRPMDLDDAVLRRLTRRILVDLPDAANREKILRVLLKDEEFEDKQTFNFTELARLTEGYSGSDLKNVCIAAAHKPIQELLKKEKAERKALLGSDSDGGSLLPPAQKKVKLRGLTLEDFTSALEEVRKSVGESTTSLKDIHKWNSIYGDNGSKTKLASLSYFA